MSIKNNFIVTLTLRDNGMGWRTGRLGWDGDGGMED